MSDYERCPNCCHPIPESVRPRQPRAVEIGYLMSGFLESYSDEEFISFLDALKEARCLDCGRTLEPREKCRCWNGE